MILAPHCVDTNDRYELSKHFLVFIITQHRQCHFNLTQ